MLELIKNKYFQFRGEEGVTAIEYGLLAALIAVAIIAAVTLLGNNLSDLFKDIADEVSSATSP